jgi:fructokinase
MFSTLNIREIFIPDRQKHLARMRRMIALADIVKLSDEDLAWFAEPGEEHEVIGRWLARGRSSSWSAALTARCLDR